MRLQGSRYRYIITALIIASASTAMAGTQVYLTRDAEGNPVFSDRKSTNAETHEIKDLPLMPALKLQQKPLTPSSNNDYIGSYTSLSIIHPANNTTLTPDKVGTVDISGVLSPGLRGGDQIVLLDNGAEVARGNQTSFRLNHLDRGEHQLMLEVRNVEGKTMITSQSVTIYVQRASSLKR